MGLFWPRLFMIFVYFSTTWFSKAFETWWWPLWGFFFAPYTTLAYMAAMLNNNHILNGWWIVLFGLAIITDFGAYGHTYNQQNKT